MADRSLLPALSGDDDVPQTPRLQLISDQRPYEDTVPPPTRPARLTGSTRLLLCGFLVIVGFLAGVAAQKHHDAGYLSPDAVARAVLNANASSTNTPPNSPVPHTDVPAAR
jgi:hypothetical protein